MVLRRLHSTFLIVLLLCGASATRAQTSSPVNEKLTPQQLIQDLDFYVKTLRETHVDPFIHISEKEWLAHVEKIKSQIATQAGMTREEFWLLFAPLVSSIQDGHTFVDEPRFLSRNATTRYLPFHTIYVNDKVVVTKSLAEVPIPPGTVITSINHVDSEQVIRKLSHYAYGTENERMWFAGDWLRIGLSEVFGKREVVALTLADGTSLEVKPLTLSELRAKESATKTEATKTNDAPLVLNFLEGNVAYVSASTFSYDLQKYLVLLREVFTRIKASGARHLIVDVRSNKGGNSMLGDELMDMFNGKPFKTYSASWKRSAQYVEYLRKDGEKVHRTYLALKPGDLLSFESVNVAPSQNSRRFNGDVYILSSEDTFSSALMFLAVVKDNNLAKIIGEESISPACFAGEVYTFKLPNSGLGVSSSVKYWWAPAGCKGERGIVPDVVVKKQVEDYATGRDRILEKTLDMIRQQR